MSNKTNGYHQIHSGKPFLHFGAVLSLGLAFSACGGGHEASGHGDEENLDDSSETSSGGRDGTTLEEEGTIATGGVIEPEAVDPCPEITGTEDVVGPGCVQLGRLRVEDLEILPGTTVKVHKEGRLAVEGEFIALGTELEPIIFESAEEEPLPGDWECLSFEGGPDSEMSYVTVRHAGSGCENTDLETPTALLLAESPRTFSHIAIEESAGDGLQLLDGAYNIRTFEELSLRNIEGRSVVAEAVGAEGLGVPILLDVDDRSVVIVTDLTDGIRQDTTWKNLGVPYEVDGILDLDRSLTIEAGTVLLMSERVLFRYDGSLIARGTAEAPIRWTSREAEPAPGDWGCIALGDSRGESVLQHNIFEYAGNAGKCTASGVASAIYSSWGGNELQNLSFSNIEGVAIYQSDCDATSPDWCGFDYSGVEESVLCDYGKVSLCEEAQP